MKRKNLFLSTKSFSSNYHIFTHLSILKKKLYLLIPCAECVTKCAVLWKVSYRTYTWIPTIPAAAAVDKRWQQNKPILPYVCLLKSVTHREILNEILFVLRSLQWMVNILNAYSKIWNCVYKQKKNKISCTYM